MKFAKTASAGVSLALAVAALALAGCGGDSSDSESSTAAAGGSASGGSGSGAGVGSPDRSDSGAGSAKAGAGAGGSAAQGGQPAPGGRQGPAVPPPTATPAPKITPQQRREATVASMTLESPSGLPSTAGPEALPAQHTCDGRNVSPALRWQGVPQGTAELALFAMNVQPVEGKLFFDWAVAGLDPELEEIEAGKLPRGAVVGRNSFGGTGYEICPEDGSETYIFTLFALPEKLSPAQGFDPFALRKAMHGATGGGGLLALSYTRG
jgi:phosphatidylethanolamine-binding protein (PEBP) family uncharacterized protein